MLEKSVYSLRNITNDKIIKYIDDKFIPQNQFMWRTRLDSENRYIPIIQRDVETFLVSILYSSKPKKVLELGTAIGYSSMVMANVLKNIYEDFAITTIERNQDMIKMAEKNIKEQGFEEKIEIIQEECVQCLKKISQNIKHLGTEDEIEKSKFDLIFIDAGKSHYLEFWKYAMDIIKKGGIIICDNIFMRGMTVDSAYDLYDKHRTSIKKMREFLDYINGDDNSYTSILPIGDGVSISYVLDEKRGN